MNKKLKIYCTLFLVVLVAVLLTSTFHYSKYSYERYPDEELFFSDKDFTIASCDSVKVGERTTTRTVSKPTLNFDVNVTPKNHTKSLYSKAAGQEYKVEMQKVKLVVPMDKAGELKGILFTVFTPLVIQTVMLIWLLWLVFRLLWKVRRGEVFTKQISKYLKISGILLVASYLLEILCGFIMSHAFTSQIQMADYTIEYVNETSILQFIIGGILLIISEIILMGKDLKEEQELTI